MRIRLISYRFIALFVALFALFVVLYQRHAVSSVRGKVAEHAQVIAPSLWNYEKSNTAYLTLAAHANHYVSIVIEDRFGLQHVEIAGPAPTKIEGRLMTLKLMPQYRFVVDIEYAGEKVGTLTVLWRCNTIYLYTYVGLCLALIAIGIRLSMILKMTWFILG